MITYSQGQTLLQTMTGVQSTDTVNTALLVQLWNDSRRTVGGMNGGRWRWLETTENVLSVANVEAIEIPNHIEKIAGVTVIVGSGSTAVRYIPRQVYDTHVWMRVKQANLGYSDIPFYVYQQGGRLLFSPIPATTANTIELWGRYKLRDLSIADYTTGGVLTATNGSTALVGTGTSWTTSMAGRWIRITESDTANKGDGYWYEIASVTNATNLVLKKPYQGTSIAAGNAAYILGQVTYEPEIYHMAPIYRAVAQYWDLKENMVLSSRYWLAYDGGFEIGKSKEPLGLVGQMLEEQGETMEGPYVRPYSKEDQDILSAPYYLPFQDATGF